MPTKTYRCALILLGAVALAGCGGGSDKTEAKLAAPFAYDSSKPLDLATNDTEHRSGGIEVDNISFEGPGDERLLAYLVKPAGAGKHPAVIYAHGAGGDRSELLDRAVDMARKGAVTLTLEMNYSPSRTTSLPPGMEGVRARVGTELAAVTEVRRTVDLLRSLDYVDGDRIGYVGWSAGARMGAITAGVEHRIKAFDLLAGGATPVSQYVDLAPKRFQPELGDLLPKTDPLRYVGHAAPSALFFEDGRHDEIVPIPALKELARVASKPKELRWYDSGHVPSEQAWSDSLTWLSDRLGLDSTQPDT